MKGEAFRFSPAPPWSPCVDEHRSRKEEKGKDIMEYVKAGAQRYQDNAKQNTHVV
jgi:hypothetical protein